MTRARRRLVLAYPARDRARRAAAAVAVRRGGARRGRAASGRTREEELFGPAETLQSTFRMLRDELLTTVAQVGGRLGELRFDTDLDVSHAVVRYLELLKLAALLERTRAGGQSVAEALPRGQRAAAAGRDRRAARDLRDLGARRVPARRRARRALRARAVAQRTEPSLEPFLPAPRRRAGAAARPTSRPTGPARCKYKFARVFRIPPEPTLNQRFGILVHQVLERYHAGGAAPARCPSCSACSRPAGGAAASATPRRSASCAPRRRRRSCATTSASRSEEAEPVWFERAFSVPHRPAPAARARRPRRQAARRRLRADRLQDRPAEVRRPAARGRAALALRGRRARGVAARGRPPGLLLRARRREGPGAERDATTATGSPRP